MLEENVCYYCRWFNNFGIEGECRKKSPDIAMQTDRAWHVWPVTSTGDWCGDFTYADKDEDR